MQSEKKITSTFSSEASLIVESNSFVLSDGENMSGRASIEKCAKTRPPESRRVPSRGLPDECDRVRLIGDLIQLMNEPSVPEGVKRAGLELIGFLARRLPHEMPHTLGAWPGLNGCSMGKKTSTPSSSSHLAYRPKKKFLR